MSKSRKPFLKSEFTSVSKITPFEKEEEKKLLKVLSLPRRAEL